MTLRDALRELGIRSRHWWQLLGHYVDIPVDFSISQWEDDHPIQGLNDDGFLLVSYKYIS
jgi:hypothetical protein